MSERTFNCYMCSHTFQSSWSDEEAEVEYEKTFGKHIGEKRAILCEICNDIFLAWYAQVNKSKVQQ